MKMKMKMKNTNIIFITLIFSFLLYLGFEISAGKINFGSAFWSDTLSNRITTNKAINLRPGDSLYYNGNVVTSGSSPALSIDTTKYLTIYNLDTSNIGFLGQPQSWTELNEFSSVSISTSLENIGSTTLADIIATGDLDISGFTKLGGASEFVKTKLVKAYIGTSVNWYSAYHGIANARNIISWDCKIWDDSSSKFLPLGYNFSAGMSTKNFCYVKADSACYYWDGTSGNIKTDTAYFWITYK